MTTFCLFHSIDRLELSVVGFPFFGPARIPVSKFQGGLVSNAIFHLCLKKSDVWTNQ